MNQHGHQDGNDWDLLGYALGALDRPEQNRLDDEVAGDPHLQYELEEIKTALAPLNGLVPPSPPPAGMARRTCEAVALAGPAGTSAGWAAPGPAPASSRRFWQRGPQHGELALAGSSGWSLSDLITLAMVALVMAAILLPAVQNSRFHSRILGCQQHLTRTGRAMLEFSSRFGGRWMEVPSNPKLAVAGSFGPILCDNNLIDPETDLWCPGVGPVEKGRIPTCDQVKSASGEELARMQRDMAGHFGVALGYLKNGEYVVPRKGSRTRFVLLADQPSSEQAGRASSNHGGYGQNCFFEDGHTEFVKSPVIDGDAIYENDQSQVAPGLHAHDIVVAPSPLRLGSAN